MPRRHVTGLRQSIGAGAKIPVIKARIDMMHLHELHQVHGVDAAGEPAVGVEDAVADCLGAGDTFVAGRNSACAVLCLRDHEGHRTGRRILPRYRPKDRVDCRIHCRVVRRTTGLQDPVQTNRVGQYYRVVSNNSKAQAPEYLQRQVSQCIHPPSPSASVARNMF
jgi:hypothetical protein